MRCLRKASEMALVLQSCRSELSVGFWMTCDLVLHGRECKYIPIFVHLSRPTQGLSSEVNKSSVTSGFRVIYGDSETYRKQITNPFIWKKLGAKRLSSCHQTFLF